MRNKMLTKEKNKLNRYVILIVAVAALGGLLFGFDTSIIAGATPFIQQDFSASNWQIEMVVSFCVLGAFFGALLSGRFTDRFGRKRVMIATGLIFIVGTLIAAFPINIEMIVIGRFILGFAIGIASYAAPLFIAEVAPPKNRGSLVLWNGAFLTGGQVLAFMVGYAFTASGNWQAMILSGIIPAFLLFAGMIFMPYSPKWLVSKGKKDQAHRTLNRIRNTAEEALHELKHLENTLNVNKASFRAIFTKRVRPVLYLGLALGIFQQFFGINTVMYYGPHIMASIGFKGSETQMFMTMVLGIVNFVFTVVTIIFIDKLGRRLFLFIGSALAAISLFLMSYFLHDATSSTLVAYMALICLIVYVIGYCISVGSLFWLIISEIFPLDVRGACMSFVASIQWLANFVVAATFLTILNTLGVSTTFSLYAIVALICCIITYFFVPETKNVELETIEDNLNAGAKLRELGNTA
ncbi:sugar porter family MFS transporter [Fangia hongkongensis]|uniref:sugar porter family MFS transporter n=1 Tax=Fangia hongkongensis TaxID=270495 RepID=UPI000381541D